MLGLFRRSAHKELTPQALAELLGRGAAMVVDVREPGEFAAGHIPGAVNLPLSGFSPDAVPTMPGRTTVLSCAGGKRSAMALDRCAAASASVDTHLAGGFGAWSAAGLPVER